MKMRSKALLACLVLSSSIGAAMAFPSSSRHNGMIMYSTGRPVPDQYMADSNIIHNYHHYHLSQPTEGYIWVHGEDNDYLLVSEKSHILRRIETRPTMPRASDG
ncbi:MAG TPA: RcnB family protein [Dyella sp.]|nr:RcnB family protein [Dyella sp.]